VACTCVAYPCEARMLADDPAKNPTGQQFSGVEMLTLNISESSSTSTPELPTTSPQRPCYLADLAQVEPDATNSMTMAMTVTAGLNFAKDTHTISWNGKSESMTSERMEQLHTDMLHYPAMAEMQVGTVQELKLTGAGEHPVHIHVNHMQITEMTSDASENGYFQVGDHHDTLYLPDLGDGSVKVRMQLDTFTGKMVVHCHVLTHEDEGMMAYINISGRQGTIYESNNLDPTCYRGRFSSRASHGNNSEARSGSLDGGRRLENISQAVSYGWVFLFAGLAAGAAGLRLRRKVVENSGIQSEPLPWPAESP